MEIFGHFSVNKIIKSFVCIIVFTSFVCLISFSALAEDIIPPAENVTPSQEAVVGDVEPAPVGEEVAPVGEEVAPESSPEVVNPAPVDGANGVSDVSENVETEPVEEVTPIEEAIPVQETVGGDAEPAPVGEEVVPEGSPEVVNPAPVDNSSGASGGSENVEIAPVEQVMPIEEAVPVQETASDVIETVPVDSGSGAVSENSFPMEFLKEKIIDELAKNIPFVEIVPVSIEPQNVVHEVIDVDENAVHSCGFEIFEVAILEGQAFDVAMYLKESDSSKTSVLKIGELPLGVSAKFSLNNDAIFSGILSDSEVLINVNADYGAQKGSFNFPVIYTQVDEGGASSVNICQLNLMVK